jgi:eukaryotic-like serine/threonine-protein kinase
MADGGSRRMAPPDGPVVLERYRLRRRLGAGAFGIVWMARDERLERDVAVKILPRERIVGGRFEREARAAARLVHPGIVTLYEATVDDEGAYLVSELVRGATLDRMLEQGQLSDRDIVALGVALCDALMHAHAQGIVHRDVKPSNVLVPEEPSSPAGAAKLTDFGVARVVGGDSLTRTGDVIGTLAYMAPEQAEGLEAGPPADLYSLALVLYEALTGVNPVRIGTAARHARRLGAHLPPLRRQRRDLPPGLGHAIDMALRPRPRERGAVVELRRALVAAHSVVDDDPGVVVDPWTRTAAASARTDEGQGEPLVEDAMAPQPAAAAPAPLWVARGIGGLGAGATAGWLSSVLLTPSPLAPAGVAVLAAGVTLLLPRLGWVAAAAWVCGIATAQGHSGGAVVVLIAMLLPALLMLRSPTAWPLAAAAPALGLAGLAGAWPALAARAVMPWRRAALGFAGWIGLLLAAPLAGRALYLPLPSRTPSPGVWIGSPSDTVHRVLAPLLSSGALAPGVVWALGALILPWLVRGRRPALDLVLAVVWAALVVSASAVAVTAAGAGGVAAGAASTATVGAVAAAVVALAPVGMALFRRRGHSEGSSAGFP